MKKWRDLLLVIYKKEALNFKTHFLVFPKKNLFQEKGSLNEYYTIFSKESRKTINFTKEI
jgi:hypothetical protein